MFTLPLACLLLTALGQAEIKDSDTDIMLRKAEQAVIRGDLFEISSLLNKVAKAYEVAKEPEKKGKLKKVYWELKNKEQELSQKKAGLMGISGKRDKSIALIGEEVNKALYEGKNSFLALRGPIEKVLKNSTSEAPVDQMGKFALRKVLADIDTLAQLDQDPDKRADTEKLFHFMDGKIAPDQDYPAEKGETSFIKRHCFMQKEASRLFGPASFIRLRMLTATFSLLANECCRGQMPDLDLQAEMEREFEPYLNSEWGKTWSFKMAYGELMAMACLSPKGKNHERLAKVINELEEVKSAYGESDSSYFLETISYRLLMLAQQGRHAECIQKFQEITVAQLSRASEYQILCLIDIYLSAAQSYEALGKKELALVQQEMAFSFCLHLQNPKCLLVRFKKSVARDLRDKYAQNNRWKDARNLEERCQLVGLGFDPLPKQPNE